MSENEYTFFMLKPDTLRRGLVDEVLDYFRYSSLSMSMMNKRKVDEDEVESHYSHVPEDIKPTLHEYFDNEEVIVGVLEGENAVDKTRSIIGDDFRPEGNSLGTIRGDAHRPESPLYHGGILEEHYNSEKADEKGIPLYNFIHAAGSFEEAEEEIERFLGASALEYL